MRYCKVFFFFNLNSWEHITRTEGLLIFSAHKSMRRTSFSKVNCCAVSSSASLYSGRVIHSTINTTMHSLISLTREVTFQPGVIALFIYVLSKSSLLNRFYRELGRWVYTGYFKRTSGWPLSSPHKNNKSIVNKTKTQKHEHAITFKKQFSFQRYHY